MKNKKTIFIIIAIILLAISGVLTYYFLTKEDKISTLNLFEKQWIESNKNNVIDMSIMNDIPIFSYNGEGLIIDFLDSLNKETNLSFNKVSYKLNEEIKSEYSFQRVDEVKGNDLLIYEDNYVILTKNNKKINSLEELKGLTLGVLNENLEKVNNYLFNAQAKYEPFNNNDEMLAKFKANDTTLDGIIMLKTTNLKTILNEKLNIAYNISDYKASFILKLGNTEKLNTILTKYYQKWAKDNFTLSYNKYLAKDYFNFKTINDSEAVKYRSKRYTYGFIENAPYDTALDTKLAGINNELLASFSKLTNVEISYKKYNSINDLLNALNTNQIDFAYGINSNENYNIDIYKTLSSYNNDIVVLNHTSNNIIISSIKSLNNVNVIKDSRLEKYLIDANVSVVSHENMKELIKKVDKDSLIAIDINNYNYYHKDLKNFIISYHFKNEDYSFIMRDISDNKIFNELFNFYISFNNNDTYVNNGLNKLLVINKTPFILKYVAIILGTIVGILLVVLGILKLKPKKKKTTLSKGDKLRYVDALTSLKNRNYLNDSVEKWDSSEIYPQAIVIVDLNNIAYINDNYGHAEGDLVIKEAANVLILNQSPNSEIIRTNGNEFLIYLVDYEEKQVITYMRKLGKELKELSHGFSAAIGYSMINDAIKTVDDAINEATIDMRTNKEETTKD
ncbi:MAG: GGDEF domain-containing protein [Bacilli bacterium]